MAVDVDRVQALFAAAAGLSDPAARSALLDRECNDDVALRRRVDLLLRAHDDSRGLPAADPAPTGFFDASVREGVVVAGRFKLVELIGEGGMGAVWLAEQTEPVKRSVALKLVKPGMDSKAVLSRFEAERQALALMDHPNIARVHDGGVTEQGRPYFVMELVKGLPLTEYCDARRLTIRERLDLFGQVCAAVQHAHQKGIIHRDLKPSNIVVTEYDGRPVPKVIDFGLAKALGPATMLTERTLQTAFGTVVGTPTYMAPEQVGLNALDVDTRSDVYALGVILYELLTGTTPLKKGRLKEAAWEEVRRVIREEEPPKPSSRLSDSRDALPSISAQRHTEPAALTKLVKGELDWIVMKALEKDRSRRFETANAMARDVERYLNDEAVEAGPPGAMYRIHRFARKYRGLIVVTAAFMMVLAAGTAVSLWQAFRASKAESHALAALDREAEQRRLAESSAAESWAVLEFVIEKIFGAAGPKGIAGGLGPQVTMRAAVEAAIPHVETSFKAKPRVEAYLRWTIGRFYARYGDHDSATKYFHSARDLFATHFGDKHELAIKCLMELGSSYMNQGRFADAAKTLEDVLAIYRVELKPQAQRTLGVMNNLAMTYYQMKKYDAAIQLHRESLEIRQATLAADDPAIARSMTNLANCYFRTNRMQEAVDLYNRAYALLQSKSGPDDYLTLMAAHNLANVHREMNRFADALKLDEETLSRRRTNLGDDHPDAIISRWSIAEDLEGLNRSADAIPIVDECFKLAAGRRIHEKFYRLASLRLRHFQKANDAAGCRTTAEIWEKLNRTDADSLMQAARCRAVTAAVIRANVKSAAGAKREEAEANQAMVWMHKAIAAGYSYKADLKPERDPKQDHDLDSLRDRDDFKKLIAVMDAKKK